MNLGAFGNLPPGQRPPAFAPGGYLSLIPSSSSLSPIPSSDQASKTVVYYRPDTGNMFPVLRNGVFEAMTFDGDLELALTSAFTANGIFDVFATCQGGQPRLLAGPAWETSTAGSGDRGSDPGDSELERVGGLLVNKWAIPGLNGNHAGSLGPREGVYLGSLLIDGSAGQVSCLPAYGQSRKWGVWNAYNRRPIVMKAGDTTTSWTYATATIRPSNNDTGNSCNALTGLAEEPVSALFGNFVVVAANGRARIGVGWNATAAFSGRTAFIDAGASEATSITVEARHEQTVPPLGLSTVTALEISSTATTITFDGGEDDHLLVVKYRG